MKKIYIMGEEAKYTKVWKRNRENRILSQQET